MYLVINGPYNIIRGDIRNKRWVDWTVTWDGDWEQENKEQNLAIYEDDTRNTQSLSLSLSTKVKIFGKEVTGTVGGTLTFKSDDAIIRQNNHKWDTFFPTNRGIPGDPIRNGWLIYDNNGSVSFTLPDRTLIQ